MLKKENENWVEKIHTCELRKRFEETVVVMLWSETKRLSEDEGLELSSERSTTNMLKQ